MKGYISTSTGDFNEKLFAIHTALDGLPSYTSTAYCDDSVKHINGNVIIPDCNNSEVCEVVMSIVSFEEISEEIIFKPEIEF